FGRFQELFSYSPVLVLLCTALSLARDFLYNVSIQQLHPIGPSRTLYNKKAPHIYVVVFAKEMILPLLGLPSWQNYDQSDQKSHSMLLLVVSPYGQGWYKANVEIDQR